MRVAAREVRQRCPDVPRIDCICAETAQNVSDERRGGCLPVCPRDGDDPRVLQIPKRDLDLADERPACFLRSSDWRSGGIDAGADDNFRRPRDSSQIMPAQVYYSANVPQLTRNVFD